MGIEMKTTGPILDGQGPKIVDAISVEVADGVGQQVYDAVRKRLHIVLVNPSGYYESRVRVDNTAGPTELVTDGGVVYGPWLEGTGSRNGRSRFKGYATFRKVSQEIASAALTEAERIVEQNLGRLQ